MKKHIDDLTGKELDRLCGEAQGWELTDTKPYREGATVHNFWMDGGETVGLESHYSPTSQTEKGMGQCFQLMVKFDIYPVAFGDGRMYCAGFRHTMPLFDKSELQKHICKAVVMSKYGEEVEV